MRYEFRVLKVAIYLMHTAKKLLVRSILCAVSRHRVSAHVWQGGVPEFRAILNYLRYYHTVHFHSEISCDLEAPCVELAGLQYPRFDLKRHMRIVYALLAQ